MNGTATKTKTDESEQIAKYWNDIANDFDAIYTGNKGPIGRGLDKWLRKDIYQRYEWVMRESGPSPDLNGMTICDVGCGSGRFVATLAKRGAQVTGLDFAPEMLRLSQQLVEKEGCRGSLQVRAQRCARLEDGPEVRSGDCDRILGLRGRPVAEIAGDPRNYEEDVSCRHGRAPRLCAHRFARCASRRTAARSISSRRRRRKTI